MSFVEIFPETCTSQGGSKQNSKEVIMNAQKLHLIPYPEKVNRTEGSCLWQRATLKKAKAPSAEKRAIICRFVRARSVWREPQRESITQK